MIARAAVAALGLGLAGAGSLAAQTILPPSRAQHDVAYYVAHAPARNATLKLCRSDMSYDRNPDCLNAQMAETRLRARDTEDVFARIYRQMHDPEWWSENGGPGLGGMVEACSNGGPTTMTPSECDAARAGRAIQEKKYGR